MSSPSEENADPAESASPAPPDFVSGTDRSGGPGGPGGPDRSDDPGGPGGPGGTRGPDRAGNDDEIEPESVDRIERLAADYVNSLLSLGEDGVEYSRAIAAIDHIGERDFVAVAAMSGRVLDRRFQAMQDLLSGKAPLARRLGELRKIAAELDPARIKLSARKTAAAEFRELDRYVERFGRSRERLEELLDSLAQGRFALEQDNAAVVTEQSSLAMEMETLRQYAYMARRVDEDLSAQVAQMAATDPDRAAALRLDVLTAIRRRREEILVELAIVTQGYAALRIVEDRNADVIRAVSLAITTTTAALRTAAMVAGAVAGQHAAMEQLDAAHRAVTAMADQAAALEAAAQPAVRIEVLRRAWAEVYAALDRVDAQKAEVLRTISQADREIARPKVGPRDAAGRPGSSGA